MTLPKCACIVACILAVNLAALADPPEYTCGRALGAITADGVLNEPTWQYAGATANAVLPNSSAPAPEAMTVQMAWDDNYLYAAFTVADVDVYATITDRDSSTWNQDNVELFAWLQDPVPGETGTAIDYVEYEWSPIAAIWDGLFDRKMHAMPPYSTSSAWNSSGLQVGATIQGTLNDASDVDEGFTVEVAIPWGDIYYHTPGGIPVDGTQIRMNVCRISWGTPEVVVEGSSASGRPGSTAYYTWAPLSTDVSTFFHQAENFGTVTFSTEPVPEPATAMLLSLAAAPLLRRRRRAA